MIHPGPARAFRKPTSQCLELRGRSQCLDFNPPIREIANPPIEPESCGFTLGIHPEGYPLNSAAYDRMELLHRLCLLSWRRWLTAFNLRVESLQTLRNKDPVFTDQFTVEPDFASTMFLALDADKVPVNFTSVSVVCLVIGLARGKVE